MRSLEVEKSPLFKTIKWAIKEGVIAKYKSEYFEEHGKEPSIDEVNLIKRLLDEEMDELISSYVSNHLQELFAQAKDVENKSSNIKDLLMGGVVFALIVGGITWRLSEKDFGTAGLLALILIAIIIFWIKK